jgi:hypothetical protein
MKTPTEIVACLTSFDTSLRHRRQQRHRAGNSQKNPVTYD